MKIKLLFLFLTLQLLFASQLLYPRTTIKRLNIQDKTFNYFRKQVITSRNMLNYCNRHPDKKLKASDFPVLRIAYYKLRTGDKLINIASKTYLDMDTVISINSIASVHAWKTGIIIRIPNMRGIIYKADKNTNVFKIAKKYKIKPSVILVINKLNRSEILKGESIFIPDGTLPREEKALFFESNKVFSHPFIIPVKGRVSSGYGYRKDPFTKKRTYHGGTDIAAPKGTKVYCTLNGTVDFAAWNGGYGRLIIVRHKHGYQSFYGHLSKILVKVGQKVKRGQLIGKVGSTGRSTGPHLHFEIRKNKKRQNPEYYMKLKHK